MNRKFFKYCFEIKEIKKQINEIKNYFFTTKSELISFSPEDSITAY